MGGMITRQPNGLYARFSTVVDDFTDINMTKDDYIKICIAEAIETAKMDAEKVLRHYLHDFDEVMESWDFRYPRAKKKRERIMNAMSKPINTKEEKPDQPGECI